MAIEGNENQNVKKSTVGGESFEEHSLADQVKFDQHQAAQGDRDSKPQSGKFGLGIFRTRVRHGRP